MNQTLPLKFGYTEIKLDSWQEFFSIFLNDKIRGRFIWRGQKDANFNLISSFDRLSNMDDIVQIHIHMADYLAKFKSYSRGKVSKMPDNDNEWWALGQHYGLLSPLLDWSESPFIALYFAMSEAAGSEVIDRAVYALNVEAIKDISRKVENTFESKNIGIQKELFDSNPEYYQEYLNLSQRPPIVEFISPFTGDIRLLSQRGLFTMAPTGQCIKEWIERNVEENDNRQILIKIIIPNRMSNKCIEALDHMNINPLTIFPDLIGATKYANYNIQRTVLNH